MNKKNIDLSDIKEFDLDKTSSFTDLMSRSERRKRKDEKEKNKKNIDNIDIEDMLKERKRNTKDLTKDIEKARNRINEEKNVENKLENTQLLELTRQMKFNINENIKEEKQ